MTIERRRISEPTVTSERLSPTREEFTDSVISDDADSLSQANGSGGEVTCDSPLVDKLHELERRVSAACDASSDKTASQLGALLDDLQHGIVAAQHYAASERDAAYDPAREPDLHAANERMNNAQLLHGRLATQQPRLLRRLQQVQQADEIAAYIFKRDALRTEHEALQGELTAVYADAASKIIDVFSRARAFWQRRMTELGPPPSGVDGFPEFAAMRLLDKVVLFDLDGQVQTWPPPSTFASDFVSSVRFDTHPGAAWSDPEVQQRQRAERETEQQRNAAYYARAAKDAEARSNRELRDQFEASQRQRSQRDGQATSGDIAE